MTKKIAELISSINDDPVVNAVFKRFPHLYLVGGFIRDKYLGKDNPDRDFIVAGDLIEIADKLAKLYNLTKVVLNDNITIRLVFKDKKNFIDLTRLRDNLINDLSSRDFTINSIAYNPSDGIVDPQKGLDDLEYGLIRTVREDNLIDDPLRMLRAYRFLSELNGDIEERTRQWIIKNSGLIINVASERITSEIIKLISADYPYRALFTGLKDGILKEVFSLNKKNLDFIIKNISLFYKKVKELPEDIKKLTDENFDMGLTVKGLMLLEVIAQGSDFDKWKLCFSNSINGRIRSFLKKKDRARCLLKNPSESELYECFKVLSPNLFEFIFFTGAYELFTEMNRFLNIQKKPLVDGNIIKHYMRIDDGPEIGKLIELMKKAEFEGRIKSINDAEAMLESLK